MSCGEKVNSTLGNQAAHFSPRSEQMPRAKSLLERGNSTHLFWPSDQTTWFRRDPGLPRKRRLNGSSVSDGERTRGTQKVRKRVTSPTQCASLRSHLRTAALRPAFDLETHEVSWAREEDIPKSWPMLSATQGLGSASAGPLDDEDSFLTFLISLAHLYPCTMRCLGFLTRSPLRNAVPNHASCLEESRPCFPFGAQNQQGRSPLKMMLKPQALGSFLFGPWQTLVHVCQVL